MGYRYRPRARALRDSAGIIRDAHRTHPGMRPAPARGAACSLQNHEGVTMRTSLLAFPLLVLFSALWGCAAESTAGASSAESNLDESTPRAVTGIEACNG